MCDEVCAAFGGEWVLGETETLKQCNRETEDWCFGEWRVDEASDNEYCDDCIPWGGEWVGEQSDLGIEWWCDDCTPLGGEWLYSEQNDEFHCDYNIMRRSTFRDGEFVFNEGASIDLSFLEDLADDIF